VSRFDLFVVACQREFSPAQDVRASVAAADAGVIGDVDHLEAPRPLAAVLDANDVAQAHQIHQALRNG